MTRAVLSLGSNLGDRAGHLRQAVAGLRDVLIVASGVYETPPWGDPDQPAYFNAAAIVAEPGAGARVWLDRARACEREAGRVRDPARRFGPRTLDVDVIAVYADSGEPVLSDDPELILPHPRAHQRAFVLRPWIDIEPYARLPGYGSLSDLLQGDPLAADVAAVRPRPDVAIESS